MPAADLDGVTVDAFGTLVQLRDPVPELAQLTGAEPERVRAAFAAEARHYVARSHEGRDPASLARLRAECAGIFNRELGSSLTPEQFVGALVFEEIPGAGEAVAGLASRGLALAVVANWDYTLPEHLERLGLAHHFRAVVTSAEVGAPKPDPLPFRAALGALGIEPARALHIGDDEVDERGAAAAGLRFLPAPVADAVAALA
jgi:putative hydrolase of the HAD superfamily